MRMQIAFDDDGEIRSETGPAPSGVHPRRAIASLVASVISMLPLALAFVVHGGPRVSASQVQVICVVGASVSAVAVMLAAFATRRHFWSGLVTLRGAVLVLVLLAGGLLGLVTLLVWGIVFIGAGI